MKVEIIPKTLHFKQPAGTSRGVYTTRKVWYIVITDTQNPNHFGVGECAPLPALSCDDVPQYEEVLHETCRRLEENMKANPENAFNAHYYCGTCAAYSWKLIILYHGIRL